MRPHPLVARQTESGSDGGGATSGSGDSATQGATPTDTGSAASPSPADSATSAPEPTSAVGGLTSDVGSATSDVGSATSDVGSATSDVGSATSDVATATSQVGSVTSQPTSDATQSSQSQSQSSSQPSATPTSSSQTDSSSSQSQSSSDSSSSQTQSSSSQSQSSSSQTQTSSSQSQSSSTQPSSSSQSQSSSSQSPSSSQSQSSSSASSTSDIISTTTFITTASDSVITSTFTTSISPPSSSSGPSSTPSPTRSSNGVSTTSFITSWYVTSVSGRMVTTDSVTPTMVSGDPRNTAVNQRTAIIAGTTAGAFALLVLLFGIFFYRRRKAFKQSAFARALSVGRRRDRMRQNLLADDDFDAGEPLAAYRDHPEGDPGHAHTHAPSASFSSYATYGAPQAQPGMGADTAQLPPRLERARASDSGSAFREAVWPPPTDNARYEGPLAASRAIDLSEIIDTVMGPGGGGGGAGQQQHAHEVPQPWVGESAHSMRETVPGGSTHTRNQSSVSFGSGGNESQIALLEAAGLSTPRPTTPTARGGQGGAGPATQDGSPKAWIQRSPLRALTPTSQNQTGPQSRRQSQDQGGQGEGNRASAADSASVYSR
ncbi:hypothetical protein CONPUDRAFT_169869 [Coniophora puteana RWD-64-598 SS2]|uniref:Uncharacterized protein n=1 Tax=Coniophora puteana (strain RWD-64-598) TaxID=741705 RepID=A0A5M3M6M5_CONPW|nr:uncharacterized protein CONPUDRAFT_169869 [Coniophora puteana RWD-64-598 SS2]EIW75012.1 hypothetical protein CONPUDRAFT_169869 [Coniophora puteana RWD-64-598 SS2]